MTTSNIHLSLNDLIKKEADNILTTQGLLPVLESYGVPHISGSYSLGLMTWRDLDIYLEVESISEASFFGLGGKIAERFHPVKMSFRNEVIGKAPGLPNGLYWGVYLGDERAGAWKIDIWAVSKTECRRLVRYCTEIGEKLTPEASIKIMDIKSQCWKDPGYRRSYTSLDIYKAVMDKGVTTLEEFKEYLKS
jgi:hypothetical protein